MKIGIWWDDGRKIIAFPVPVGNPDSETGLCDSDDSHNDRWPDAAIQLDVSPDAEYFSIPRGRVLYDPRTRKSIIYHGNQTDTSRLKLIAAKFGLDDWKASIDNHYLMGADADEFFSQDDL